MAHTKDILAAELRKAGLPEMATKAEAGHYHDFLSPLDFPELALATDLLLAGTPAALALRARHMNGEFDARKEESDEWAASPDGQDAMRELTEPGRPESEPDDNPPIDEAHRQKMNDIALALDGVLNGQAKGPSRKTGFVLLVFPFGDVDDRRLSYISNGANRLEIVRLMKETIARFENKPQPRE